jgi:hypothetical protein
MTTVEGVRFQKDLPEFYSIILYAWYKFDISVREDGRG